MSCFKGRMQEYTSVSLDRFDGRNLSSTVFCLSHCHQDHMAGLDAPALHNRLKSRTDLFLYCSELTKTLLLADNRYTHLKKFIRTLEVDVPTMVTIPDQEGDNKKSGTVLVTGLSAGHCPGSIMFLFEGKEGTVLYTGDFRWETNYAQNLQAFKTGDSVKNIKSLYIDTTFCFEDAFHFPSRNECVEAASELVSKWLDHSKNHVVSLSCKAKYGYEHFLQELYSRTGEKIHTSLYKCNIYQQIGELKDVFTSDPSARIHVCNFKSDRSPLSKLPCGYVPSDSADQQVLILRPSTMFFALQRPHSRSTDLIVYPKGSRGLHRVCYSFHSSYVEVRDLVMFLKPDRVFPNVKPPNESDMTKVQARLNGFLKMVHLSEVPSLIAPSRLLGQLKIRRTIYADSSQSDSEGLNFGSQETKKSVVHRSNITPTKRDPKDSTPSEASNADSSYQGSVGREDEEELDLFGSQESVTREPPAKTDNLAAGDSEESYCLYVSGDEDCPEEDRVCTQSFPDLDDVIVIESQDSPSDMAMDRESPSDKAAAEPPNRGPSGEPVSPMRCSSVRDSDEGLSRCKDDQLDTDAEGCPDSGSDTKKLNDQERSREDDLLLDAEDDLLKGGTDDAVSSSGRDKEKSLKDRVSGSRTKEDDILMDSDNDLLDEVVGKPSDKELFLPEKTVKDKERCKDEEILVDSGDELLDTGDEEDALGKVTVELLDDEDNQLKCREDGVERIDKKIGENCTRGKGSQDDINITGGSNRVIDSCLGVSDVKTNTESLAKLDKVNVDTSTSGVSPEGESDSVITISDNQIQPNSKVILASDSEIVNPLSCEKPSLGDKTNNAKSRIGKSQSVDETMASVSNSLDPDDKDSCSVKAQKLQDGTDGERSSLQTVRAKEIVSNSQKSLTKLQKTSSFDLFDEGHVTDIEDNAIEDITETQGFDVEVLESEMRSRRRKYITEIDQNEERTLRRATAQMLLRLQAGSQSSSGCPRTLSRPVDSGEQIVISSSESDTESGFLSGGKEGGKAAQGSVTGREYAKNLGTLVSKMEKRLASSDGEYSPSKRIRLDISRNCESDSDVTLPPSQGSYASRLHPCLFFDSDSVSESESEMDSDSDAVEILYETDASGAKYDVLGNLMRPETTIVRTQTQTAGQALKVGESQFIDLTEDIEEVETDGDGEKVKMGGDDKKDKCFDECSDDSADESKKLVVKDTCDVSACIEVVEGEGQNDKVKDSGEGSGVMWEKEKVKGSGEVSGVNSQKEKVKDIGEGSGVVDQNQEDMADSDHRKVGDCGKNYRENMKTSKTLAADLKGTEEDDVKVTAVEESRDSN